MNDLIHVSQLIAFGLSGIMLMIFIKIDDVNKKPENAMLTWRQTVGKFFRKEWASYLASITIVLITSYSHEEWMPIFTQKVSEKLGMPLGVKLYMVLWAMFWHYILYKFVFGKMDKDAPPAVQPPAPGA